jgi:hypothetical protein
MRDMTSAQITDIPLSELVVVNSNIHDTLPENYIG